MMDVCFRDTSIDAELNTKTFVSEFTDYVKKIKTRQLLHT
jgi:hypothetical protein